MRIGGIRIAVAAVCCAGAVYAAAGSEQAFLAAGSAFAAPATPVPTCKADLAHQLEILDVPGLSAAVIKDDRVVCTAAAGMADIERNRPVTPDTLFLIASVSKTVTATALMQLHEQGKFRLDDDINRYLPFKVRIPAAPTAPITFRQLLTHTASIRDNETYIDCPGSCDYGATFGSLMTRGADSPIPLADFTKGYFTPDGDYYDEDENFRSHGPGAVSRYSNMGIVLAGYLTEVISGIPFDQYCNDHIFKPLGMAKTSWRLAGIDQSTLAMPYDKSSAGFVPYGHYGEPNYPDGMLRTSVTELAQFLAAYMQGGRHNGHQLLRSATVREMLKSQTPLEPTQGLVWSTRSLARWSGPAKVWGHDGSDFGAGAKMWFDPTRKAGVILMTNGVWKNDQARALLASLFEEANGD